MLTLGDTDIQLDCTNSQWELVSSPIDSCPIFKHKVTNEFRIVQVNSLVWPDYGKTPKEVFEEDVRRHPEAMFHNYYIENFDSSWYFYTNMQKEWFRYLYSLTHPQVSFIEIYLEPPFDRHFWTTQGILDSYQKRLQK